ncbi:MAG: FtsW/RodA/SpoVE family cell cycle protein, partial [SAR86 cluster bacterium]|nr:FtsW/RodA/SpoVE family cell cycle protein [SAR86 cluster bacterium]
MSQDFVRRLPGGSFSQSKYGGLGRRVHLDFIVIALLMIISSYGLVVLYSAVGHESAPVISQLMKLSVATLVMLTMAQIPPVFYLRAAPWLYFLGIALLIMVLFFGYEVNGSARWLRIPGIINFQPSEIMKLVVPMILAWYFHERHMPPKAKHLFWAAVMIAIPVV